jgi:hypothetical protein
MNVGCVFWPHALLDRETQKKAMAAGGILLVLPELLSQGKV